MMIPDITGVEIINTYLIIKGLTSCKEFIHLMDTTSEKILNLNVFQF